MRKPSEAEEKIIQALVHAGGKVDQAGGTFIFAFIVESGAPFIARGGDALMGVGLSELVKSECIHRSRSNEQEVAR